MNMQTSMIFKTPEFEHQYMATYEAVLKLWPVPHETMDIHGQFGITYINLAGEKRNPRLILLPGFGANSAQCFVSKANHVSS
jgi:hypothetical protein